MTPPELCPYRRMVENRAVESKQRCFVRFVNTTKRAIEVMWMNYTGQYTHYGNLKNGEFLDVNTFKTHPWVAIDSITRDQMCIDGLFFLYPRTTKEIVAQKYPGRQIPEFYEARVRVYITLPVYSLRTTCLLAVRDCLKSEEQAEQLGLPRSVVDDLKTVVKKRNENMEKQFGLR